MVNGMVWTCCGLLGEAWFRLSISFSATFALLSLVEGIEGVERRGIGPPCRAWVVMSYQPFGQLGLGTG